MTPALRIFVFFFALYALTSSGNAFRVPDEFEVYFQAQHLLDAGDISVPQTLAITQGGQSIFFGRFGRDGRPYAPYGPGVAFLIAPFHAAGRLLAGAAGIPRRALPEGIAWEFFVGGVTMLAMAGAAALAAAGYYRASRALGASERRARVLTLVLGVATLLWPYGTALYSEAWLAAMFVWSAALLIEARETGSPWRAAAAAALLALAGLTKPTALVIAPGLILAAALDARTDRHRRTGAVLALLAGTMAGALAQIAWNLWRFGAPLEFGYNLAGMILAEPARAFRVQDVPRGVFVQLLTPGKSIFVWAPPIMVAFLAVRESWAHERGLAAGVVVATAAAVFFYAAFLFPEGGYAHGPRHLLPLVPLAMLVLAVPAVRVPARALAASAMAGTIVGAFAVSVSFLEDQAPVQADPRATGPYYERVDPPAGRPWLRYRLDYVPFRTALTSGHWASASRAVGNGPDFFALHLARARAAMPGGEAIPRWLPWAMSMPWLAVLVVMSPTLLRRT